MHQPLGARRLTVPFANHAAGVATGPETLLVFLPIPGYRMISSDVEKNVRGRIRTCDLLLRRQPLYPAELREQTCSDQTRCRCQIVAVVLRIARQPELDSQPASYARSQSNPIALRAESVRRGRSRAVEVRG